MAETMFMAIVVLCSVGPARAEYQLGIDDVLEISVAGIPELKQRVTVQPDGTISFPLLGTITAAGLSLSEVRSKIQSTLATKIFRQRVPDGRENVIVIEPDHVTATIAEYRPVYVNGDVSKPGQQSYRPSMTVRQAVALAGGYDIMRFRMTNNPFLESSDLRGEYESRWAEFAKERAHAWRVKYELGDKKEFDQGALANAPISQAAISEIVRLESEQLKTRETDHQREKAFIQHGIEQANQQIAVLSDEQKKEEEGVQADVAELRKVTDLYGKGSLPSPRVTDARRGVLLSATRKLQTSAQLMQVQRQRDELSRQLEKVDDQRRIDLLRELQDSKIKLSDLQSKLQSIAEKLQYTGIVTSQLVRGNGAKPDLVIIRKAAGKDIERLAAEEDSELQPGDVVEVALHQPPIEVPDKTARSE